MTIVEVMETAPVIPVLVVDDVADAVPLALALVAGGLPVIEVTLRTPAALDVIREMAKVEGARVGAGTVTGPAELDAALDAGAEFVVSPGMSERLARAAQDREAPLLPGVATGSDILRGLDLGYDRFKFFPAEAAGGLEMLRALAAPFGHAHFCPTGGVTAETALTWLREPPVSCVGGSWIAPRGTRDWAKVGARARTAAALRGQSL
ncbi:MAG: bifunctional 4-hydroxy-2-oxoglutarate aldolase/2-dehydro-3-deoxy-phosphogluconate aldolase [Thermaurantiacus sp.]